MRNLGQFASSVLLLYMWMGMGISCGDSNKSNGPKEFHIDLKETELVFNAFDDNLITVNVTAVNVSWDVQRDKEWIILNTTENKFTISVSDFDSYEEKRTGKVTVSADEKEPVVINITQFGKKTSLEISPDYLEFPSFFYLTDSEEQRQRTVKIATDAPEWSVEIAEADSWLELVSKTGTSVTFTTGDNQHRERIAEVAIKAGAITKTLKVKQLTALVPYEELDGAYTASGTPAIWNGTINEGPQSWQTEFVAEYNDVDGPHYISGNYGGQHEALSGKANLFIHWLQGRPTIYSPQTLGFKSKAGYDAYQVLFIIKEDDKPYIIEGSLDGEWNAQTKTVDFSAKNSAGYDIIVGLVAIQYENGDPMIKGVFTEGYANLKFVMDKESRSIADNAMRSEAAVQVKSVNDLKLIAPHPGQMKMSELPRIE